MIAKQTKGKGFRGALEYLLGKEEAHIIGGNMIGDNPKTLAEEFKISRELRPNLNRVVYHASLSLPAGETLSNEQWADVSNKYVNQMGFEGSQFVVVRHHDTEHHHIHILASRIRLDGSVVDESHDYKRSEAIVRKLELEHGLTVVPPSRHAHSRAPTTGELHKGIREQVPSTKMQLRSIIDVSTQDKPTATEFIKRMEVLGVQVVPNVASTGHISGISFVLENEKMKGSDLGRKYTWLGLTKGAINYEQNRDFKFIQQSADAQSFEQIRRDSIYRPSFDSRGILDKIVHTSQSGSVRLPRDSQFNSGIQKWNVQHKQSSRDISRQSKLFNNILGIVEGSRDRETKERIEHRENRKQHIQGKGKRGTRRSDSEKFKSEKSHSIDNSSIGLFRDLEQSVLKKGNSRKELEDLFGENSAQTRGTRKTLDSGNNRKGEEQVDLDLTSKKNKKGRGMDFGF